MSGDTHFGGQILATIAVIVYEFTAVYPDKFVFFAGSTPERTRLYKIALSVNQEELQKDFHIYGVNQIGKGNVVKSFDKNEKFDAFLIKRKK